MCRVDWGRSGEEREQRVSPMRDGGGLRSRAEEEGRRGQGWRLFRGDQERDRQQDLVD